MNYHDLEHLSPPFPCLGEEVAIFLETEAQEGLLLYEKDGEVLQKPMARVPGGLKAQVTVAQSPFRYLFRLPEGYWGSHGLEKTLPRYDRFFQLLPEPLPPEWALGTVFYRIFPERFPQGPKELAPRDGAWLHGGKPIRSNAWHEPPGPDGSREFYGGTSLASWRPCPTSRTWRWRPSTSAPSSKAPAATATTLRTTFRWTPTWAGRRP